MRFDQHNSFSLAALLLVTTIAKIDEFLHIRAFRLSLQYSFLTQYNRIMNCRREANNTLSIGLSR